MLRWEIIANYILLTNLLSLFVLNESNDQNYITSIIWCDWKNTPCKKVCFQSCINKLLKKVLVCAYIKFNIAQSSSHGVVSFVVCDFSWWKRCCIEENMINILVVKGSAQHYWHRSFFLPKKPLSIIFEFPWFINYLWRNESTIFEFI